MVRAVATLLVAVSLNLPLASAAEITPEQARTLAQEATLFGFAIVASYRALYDGVVDRSSPGYAPLNTFRHTPRLSGPRDTVEASADHDTLRSVAFLDLRAEPIVLEVPAVRDLYYSMQLCDLVTDNFAYVGTAATGSDPGRWVIVGPGWKGDLPGPGEVSGIIPAPSWFVMVAGRTEVGSVDHLGDSIAIQEGYRLTPLSVLLDRPPPALPPAPRWPAFSDARTCSASEFFAQLSDLMQWHVLPPREFDMRRRLARIGVVPGGDFSLNAFSPPVGAAIEDGLEAGRAIIETRVRHLGTSVNGWQMPPANTGRFGTDYLNRSAVAWESIHADSPAAVTRATARIDHTGQPLDGGTGEYQLTFESQPPVEHFWSVTLYDAETRSMIPNPVHHYALGHREMDFRLGRDGDLTIYIQHRSPGRRKEANWLPAPQRPFYLVLRLYGPGPEVLDGTYRIPPVVRVK